MTEGQIFSINCSDGGVPKFPVSEALVTTSGVFGDRQANKKYHGGPDRAVCLFSSERILALQDEGHPIGTGTTGENITLSGIDWDLVTPGSRFDLGEAVLEVTSYTKPCRTIRESFVDEHFVRMSQKLHPGWSRVYAKVLKEGLVRTGDKVTLTLAGTDAPGFFDALLS